MPYSGLNSDAQRSVRVGVRHDPKATRRVQDMLMRKILERLRGSTKPTQLEQAQADFKAAARELAEVTRKARAAGRPYTEMGAAAERRGQPDQRSARHHH